MLEVVDQILRRRGLLEQFEDLLGPQIRISPARFNKGLVVAWN